MNKQISICIIAKDEAAKIGAGLKSICPPGGTDWSIEIILVDNGSKDCTKELFQEFLVANPQLDGRLIESPSNNLAASRNIAIKESKYSFLAFIDADCVAPEDWLEKFGKHFSEFQNPNLLAIGGGNHPPADLTQFYSALKIALESFWGSFGTSPALNQGSPIKVAHIPTCNIVFSKAALSALDGFSEAFDFVCEDMELSVRAIERGQHMLFLTDNAVIHHHKPGLIQWGHKMFRYGYGQILVAKRHPFHLAGLKGLPLLAALIQILGLIFATKLILFVDLLYLTLTLIVSVISCVSNQRPELIPQVFSLFIVTHLSYALGEIWGAIHFWNVKIEK